MQGQKKKKKTLLGRTGSYEQLSKKEEEARKKVEGCPQGKREEDRKETESFSDQETRRANHAPPEHLGVFKFPTEASLCRTAAVCGLLKSDSRVKGSANRWQTNIIPNSIGGGRRMVVQGLPGQLSITLSQGNK